MRKYTILAAHVDDEVIGCFSLLDKQLVSKVIYFYDIEDDVRINEALACASRFGFHPVFGFDKYSILDDDLLLVPNINDSHPDHKKVNRLAKSLPNKKKYYSVDMNVKKQVLSSSDRTSKKHSLRTLFPSQSLLLSKDDKYHLFESILDDDSNKMIWVTFQKEGIHCYPAALVDENLKDVSFLGHPHRHIFHFKVSISVEHNDRDIEFIQFKRWLESLYSTNILELNYMSCEMIADSLYLEISKKYPDRKLSIEVSEDLENGVKCDYET